MSSSVGCRTILTLPLSSSVELMFGTTFNPATYLTLYMLWSLELGMLVETKYALSVT